jgi:putative oxygen-independent coproporphyrinogen III oxidase
VSAVPAVSLPCASPPLSLYVHLPWCLRKCPYCDFNSHEAGDGIPDGAYIEALSRDLDRELPALAGRPLISIFFGGGTPSLFPAPALERFLDHLARHAQLDANAEITLEANPGAADTARFRDYRALGINRLSIGVQSLEDANLRALGRIHDAGQARAAVRGARAAGFDNINIDMMYGLPGQQVRGAVADLEAAIALEPGHLSWYQLTIEPNTVFFSRPPSLPDDDAGWEIAQAGETLLEECGYARYEISAYAGSAPRCRHNVNYWEFGDYIGIGAGAHGKLTDARHGTITRTVRHRIPQRYMERAGTADAVVERRRPAADELLFEFMLNACRLTNGFQADLIGERTGLPPERIGRALETARARGFLSAVGGDVVPTATGLRYLNELLQLYLP